MRQEILEKDAYIFAWSNFLSNLMLKDKSEEVESFSQHVKNQISNFRFTSHYQLREILAEAYFRGVNKSKEGEERLSNSYCMLTNCYNIICEFWKRLDMHLPGNLDNVNHPKFQEYRSCSNLRIVGLRLLQYLSWEKVKRRFTQLPFTITKKERRDLKHMEGKYIHIHIIGNKCGFNSFLTS